jgi:hypothetical protein
MRIEYNAKKKRYEAEQPTKRNSTTCWVGHGSTHASAIDNLFASIRKWARD